MRYVTSRNSEDINHTAAESWYVLQLMPEKLKENYILFCTFSSIVSFVKISTVMCNVNIITNCMHSTSVH